MTTQEINDQIIAQLQASLNQSIPLLPKAFLRVLARVLAAVFILLYKYAGWMFLQWFVTHASNDPTTANGRTFRPLTEWGRLVGAGDPTAAEPAELSVTVTVETQGGSLPAGSQLRGESNGALYITQESVPLDAATITVDVVAVEPGTGGNLDVGAALDFVSPLSDVTRGTAVAAELVTGSDAEGTEAYRQRVINRFQRRPQGGAYADYDEWGSEAAGIAAIYPYTGDPGQVDVYVESATEPDRVPTQAQLDAVAAAIELDDGGLASRRPANAYVNTYPVDIAGFEVTVSDLDVDDAGAVQTDIAAALNSYFLSREPFIVGLSIPPRQDRITVSTVGSLIEQIVADAGGIVGSVALASGGSGVGLYILGAGELAELTGVTYD